MIDTATMSVSPALTMGDLSHIALTVVDLSVSVPWYEKVFGLAPVLDEDTGPFRHVVFALGSTLFGLHEFPGGVRDDAVFDPHRPGLDHVSFGCADRIVLASWAARLDQLGVAHGEIVDAGYGSGLSFKDPDGLPLEVFCPPAG
jgi:catechol 2,3-dioxygenase-like lactoylglutathione lyase family enzyme